MEIAFIDVNLLCKENMFPVLEHSLHLLALHGLDSKESTGQRQAGGDILQLGQDLSPHIFGVFEFPFPVSSKMFIDHLFCSKHSAVHPRVKDQGCHGWPSGAAIWKGDGCPKTKKWSDVWRWRSGEWTSQESSRLACSLPRRAGVSMPEGSTA